VSTEEERFDLRLAIFAEPSDPARTVLTWKGEPVGFLKSVALKQGPGKGRLGELRIRVTVHALSGCCCIDQVAVARNRALLDEMAAAGIDIKEE
jgi:hypothetical protein